MVLKLFRFVWFGSVLALFANLLYHYAAWPETVVLQEEAGGQFTLNKDALFYVLVVVVALINVLVYVTKNIYKNNLDLRAWFHGLVTTINIFFIIATSLLNTYNSNEVYDYSKTGIIIYASVLLVAVWALAWPVYLLFQKFFVKQAV